LPLLLIGGTDPSLKGGKHIAAAAETPLANLYLSLMDRMGVHLDSFGDSTGRFQI
jgi:hypothetical protein